MVIRLPGMGCILLLAGAVAMSGEAKSTRPHIIMMLADDWGSYDASWRMKELGRTPDIQTPNIDELSSGTAGLRFANYYVQPICTPTRSVLMSGRYSIHTGCEHILFGSSEASCLPTYFPIMPQAFKEIGYTTAMVGKWHLGYFNDTCAPWSRGFDSYLGFLNGVEGYYAHGMGPFLDFHECVNNSDTGPHRDNVSDYNRNPTWQSDIKKSSPPPSNCDKCTLRYEGRYSTHVYTQRVQGLLKDWKPGDLIVKRSMVDLHGLMICVA